MSWKPEVKVNGQWAGNALRFATEQEAASNAQNLLQRWFLVEDSRAVECDDPVSHEWADGALFDVGSTEGWVPPARVTL